jgi:sugar lactone lactonase YvrE
MDAASILNRSWQPTPGEPKALEEVPEKYGDYIRSNAFLLGLPVASLNFPIPPTPVSNPAPAAILDQWENRMTCVAFASTEGMEVSGHIPGELSEQYTYHLFMKASQPSNDCCTDPGVYVLDAAKDLRDAVIPTSFDGPDYTTDRPSCGIHHDCAGSAHDDFPAPSKGWVVTGTGDIPPGMFGPTARNVGYLETILASGYDIVYEIGVAWVNDKYPNAGDPNGRVIPLLFLNQKDRTSKPMPERAYHAVLLTGYDRDGQYFIARNSMGAEWGNSGDAWLSYAYIAQYGVAGFIIKGVANTSLTHSALGAPAVAGDTSGKNTGGGGTRAGGEQDSAETHVVKAGEVPKPPLPVVSGPQKVAEFCAEPGSVAVSASGRIFVAFPRIADDAEHAVAEVRQGNHFAYPNRSIQGSRPGVPPDSSLISVRGLAVDSSDHLWMLDSGIRNGRPTSFGGPKLIAVDINRDAVSKVILLPSSVAPSDAVLDGLALACDAGHDYAFVSDAGSGLIVVNLSNGECWRTFEELARRSQPRSPGGGMAVSADGNVLYYRPHRSGPLYALDIPHLIGQRERSPISATPMDNVQPSTAFATDPATSALYAVDDVASEIWRARLPDTSDVFFHSQRRVPRGATMTSDGSFWVTFNGKQPSLERFQPGSS